MTLPLDFLPPVKEEIDQAYAWYQRQRQGLGEDYLAEVRRTLDQIQRQPLAWAVLYRGVRAALVRRFPYVVYFRDEPDRIVVIAVQHGHRHSRRWRSRL